MQNKLINYYCKLYCTVLFVSCAVLYCTALYSTLLYSTPLHSTPLHSTPLHSTPLHSTLLYCVVLYCIGHMYRILQEAFCEFSVNLSHQTSVHSCMRCLTCPHHKATCPFLPKYQNLSLYSVSVYIYTLSNFLK